MEYYSAIKRNAFDSVLIGWMNLEPIIQSEVSQKEEDKYHILTYILGFPGGSEGKASACNVGDPGSIPGSGRSPADTHSSILAWRIPGTGEPGGLSSLGLHRVGHD